MPHPSQQKARMGHPIHYIRTYAWYYFFDMPEPARV